MANIRLENHFPDPKSPLQATALALGSWAAVWSRKNNATGGRSVFSASLQYKKIIILMFYSRVEEVSDLQIGDIFSLQSELFVLPLILRLYLVNKSSLRATNYLSILLYMNLDHHSTQQRLYNLVTVRFSFVFFHALVCLQNNNPLKAYFEGRWSFLCHMTSGPAWGPLSVIEIQYIYIQCFQCWKLIKSVKSIKKHFSQTSGLSKLRHVAT